MSAKSDSVLDEALKLPEKERARLAFAALVGDELAFIIEEQK